MCCHYALHLATQCRRRRAVCNAMCIVLILIVRKVSIGLRLICTKVAFLLDTFLNTMEKQSCTSFVEMEELEAEQSFHPRRHAYGFRL
ncbi:uncharacterized protein LOC125674350 isoform X2 [Ostrea edulis]|uniref:uncharacterized protein LOC125674350 isoform X2 n=1 Tax=Ostrea edulis TaxID=37623 RepID=UPI0024AE9B97|nr:uncharacterized protein LOC125674350 isoform X2 [Ostrea edulis]